MSVLKRLGDDVFVNLFQSASGGKSRLPLRRALSELFRLFSGGNVSPRCSSESFMNEFYLRGVDVRCGLRSHVLMVGGPKNVRGNPRGGLDSRLFYPSITREQFLMIGRAMECVFLEHEVPHLSSGRLRSEMSTSDLERHEKRLLSDQLDRVERALRRD